MVSQSGEGLTRQKIMTTDNVNASIRDWIQFKGSDFESLGGVPILVNGDDETLEPPFIAIMETASNTWEQAGVMMHGVLQIGVSVMIQTLPVDDDEGSSKAKHQEMASDLYQILSCRDEMMFYTAERNGVSVLDIRSTSPLTNTADGRRITTFEMTVVAC